MDGNQTTEETRRRLPIVALTAMKGDRENLRPDALTKPVIAEQLLSDLRIWCTVRRA